jgi:glycosyltransferase involved in cell wall biosynthesis
MTDQDTPPTLSVITICFNNLEELIYTCKSVDSQTRKPDEHLIIDGSTNNSINTWLLNTPQPSYRKWLFECDKGIADAFNKGLRLVRSQVTHLLNSGDTYFINSAVESAIGFFTNDPELMWSHALYVQQRGGINVISGAEFDKTKLWKGMRTIAHPTMFIKKDVYERHGYYNTSLNIAMDYDMLVRIRNEKFHFIPIPIVCFAAGGVSSQHFDKGLAEVRKIYESQIGKSYKLLLWQLRQKILHSVMHTQIGQRLFQLKNKAKRVTLSAIS